MMSHDELLRECSMALPEPPQEEEDDRQGESAGKELERIMKKNGML